MSSRKSLPVPFFDLRVPNADRAEAFSRIVSGTAGSGGFILQGAVADFKSDLQTCLAVAHAVGVSNSTDVMLLRVCVPP